MAFPRVVRSFDLANVVGYVMRIDDKPSFESYMSDFGMIECVRPSLVADSLNQLVRELPDQTNESEGIIDVRLQVPQAF